MSRPPVSHPPVSPPSASATVELDASAAAVWALVTDLDALADLAEETETMTWTRGSTAVTGAVFTGRNRNGSRSWSTTCTVTDAEPGRRFAFDVRAGPLPIARWVYDVQPLDPSGGQDRCRVTESTWDRRPGWFKKPGGWLTGVKDRDRASQAHITLTLERLGSRLEDTRGRR